MSGVYFQKLPQWQIDIRWGRYWSIVTFGYELSVQERKQTEKSNSKIKLWTLKENEVNANIQDGIGKDKLLRGAEEVCGHIKG